MLRSEGGINGRYHVVLWFLLGEVIFLERVLILGRHMRLHWQERAVGRRLRMVRDIDTAKVLSATIVVSIDNGAIGEDVGEGALGAELAVSLVCLSQAAVLGETVSSRASLTLVKYLHGALSAIGSSEWRKGHAFPAWQAPWR
jgi:hypothetical protein